ncbi:MAG: TIGR02444 family protein [Pseudomonadales bacterium]
MESVTQFAAYYWRYSLDAYAQVDVQRLCLQLQDDYQANVNLLLLAGFAGSCGQAFAAEYWARIDLALASFNGRYTQRIRRLRRRVQQLANSHITAAECYQQLKTLELKAEQLEQQIIAVSCDNGVRSRPLSHQNCAADKQILGNLLAYCAGWAVVPANAEKLVRELAAALIQNVK